MIAHPFQYDDESVISIQRNGTASISPLEALQNDHLFSGVENELMLSQIYTTTFTCKYDMAAYPFDIQTCSMTFIMQVFLCHIIFSIKLYMVTQISGEQWELYEIGEG